MGSQIKFQQGGPVTYCQSSEGVFGILFFIAIPYKNPARAYSCVVTVRQDDHGRPWALDLLFLVYSFCQELWVRRSSFNKVAPLPIVKVQKGFLEYYFLLIFPIKIQQEPIHALLQCATIIVDVHESWIWFCQELWVRKCLFFDSNIDYKFFNYAVF